METALTKSKQVNIIDPKDFIQQLLQKSASLLVCHLIIMEGCPTEVHLSCISQVSTTTSELLILLEAYKDFKDVFSIENVGHLPLNKDHHHVIDCVDSKKPLYRSIYSLSENELSIFQAYIDKNLANRFIKPSKSPYVTIIFFTLKSNSKLWLYANYQSLNNLTIKN